MLRNRSRLVLAGSLAALSVAAVCPRPALAGDKQDALKLPPIYDPKADGDKQIADALKRAAADNKRVLIQFGANWCIWCHLLHDLFENDKEIAKTLLNEYELVLVDIDKVNNVRHNEAVNARYGDPIKHGVPVLVVLDSAGKQLTTQLSEPMEEGDHYNRDKVFAFLKEWSPKPQVADEVLAKALARAKSESKNVFVEFAAPWCSWCKRMDAYLVLDGVAQAFGKAFVPVKIDVDRMKGGVEVGEKYGKKEDTGLPYFAILDGSGKKLADSVAEKGNVGFPAESFEIVHFMNLMKNHGRGLSPAELATLEKGLAAINGSK